MNEANKGRIDTLREGLAKIITEVSDLPNPTVKVNYKRRAVYFDNIITEDFPRTLSTAECSIIRQKVVSWFNKVNGLDAEASIIATWSPTGCIKNGITPKSLRINARFSETDYSDNIPGLVSAYLTSHLPDYVVETSPGANGSITLKWPSASYAALGITEDPHAVRIPRYYRPPTLNLAFRDAQLFAQSSTNMIVFSLGHLENTDPQEYLARVKAILANPQCFKHIERPMVYGANNPVQMVPTFAADLDILLQEDAYEGLAEAKKIMADLKPKLSNWHDEILALYEKIYGELAAVIASADPAVKHSIFPSEITGEENQYRLGTTSKASAYALAICQTLTKFHSVDLLAASLSRLMISRAEPLKDKA